MFAQNPKYIIFAASWLVSVIGCTNGSEISTPESTAYSKKSSSKHKGDISVEKNAAIVGNSEAQSKSDTDKTNKDDLESSNQQSLPSSIITKPMTAEEAKAAEQKTDEMIKSGIAVGDTQGAELKYPTLTYKGNGTYSCKGRINPAHAQVSSVLSLPVLDNRLESAQAENSSSIAQRKINEEILNSLDSVQYKRLSSQERNDWKQKGYDLPDQFAIFSTTAQKVKAGSVFNFDKPLPVAFWPATSSRYDDLRKGPRTWSANVAGTRSFSATITLSHVSTVGDIVTLKLATNIPEDTDRTLYEIFPIPRESIATIDTKAINTTQLKNVNWHNSTHCDDRPEEILMTYKICQKITGSNVESFPCQ